MKRLASIAWLASALALLFAAAALNGHLRERRRADGITQADPVLNAPPAVVMTTVALGGFRGLIADLLWVRASTLQDEGRYFELVQLSDWITTLEPRFSKVWIFHGWNLAYNISVLFNAPEDRWRWIRHGISLLRDRGLLYNPDEPQILRELGWFFQHKMGGSSDNYHRYYKQRWAEEMMTIFPGSRPPFDSLSATQRTALVEGYRLDPDLMRKVDETYGPLDWRTTQAHAIYWAWRSKQVAKEFDAVAADRMIFQSLGDAFRDGSIYYLSDEKMMVTAPNLDLWPRVNETFKQAIADHPENSTIANAHQNFLLEAIVLLYSNNRSGDAATLLDELNRLYPDPARPVALQAFVFSSIGPTLADISDRDAQTLLQGFWMQCYYWFAIGDSGRAAGFDRLARLTWKKYMDMRQDPEFRERTGLPPIPEMRRIALEELRKQWAGTPFGRRIEALQENLLPEPSADPAG